MGWKNVASCAGLTPVFTPVIALRGFHRVVPGGGGDDGLACLFSLPDINGCCNSAEYGQSYKCPEDGLIVSMEEAEDLAAVLRTQIGERGVADGAGRADCDQEFSARILEGSGGHEEWRKGHGRRQQGRKKQAPEAVAVEDCVDSFCLGLGQLFFEGFLAAFSSEGIGDIASGETTDGGHDGIVGPPVFLMGGENDGERVHAAGKRDHGVIGQGQQNEADATEPFQPRQPDDQ